jgi:hypothetical protein
VRHEGRGAKNEKSEETRNKVAPLIEFESPRTYPKWISFHRYMPHKAGDSRLFLDKDFNIMKLEPSFQLHIIWKIVQIDTAANAR